MSDFSLASGGLLRGENDVELELENLSNVLKVGPALRFLAAENNFSVILSALIVLRSW